MYKTLFYLQVKLPEDAAKLTDYGALGIYAYVSLVALAALVVVFYKNFQSQLKDKDRIILEQKQELRECRAEMREFRDGAFNRMLSTQNETLKVVQENSIAIHENSSAVGEAKGAMEMLVKVIERLRNL